MAEPAIRIRNLHFSYGRKEEVLIGVNLEVPAGSIFGFIGPNGAGKTTTIKLLLGLLKPARGACNVLGIDPAVDPVALRRKVGYMAEDQRMYGWMRIDEIIKWVAGFYPEWDAALAGKLLEIFELSKKDKVGALSKGQNSRLALLLSLGHRPRLVILDDPTLGLDPIARKDFLRNVINLLQTNGVTVFFSSHLLYEIEPVADYVAILHKGVIIKTGRTDELRESVRKFIFTSKKDADLSRVPGVLDAVRVGGKFSITVEDCRGPAKAALEEIASDGIQETALNLDEIFEAYVIGNRGREERAKIKALDFAEKGAGND